MSFFPEYGLPKRIIPFAGGNLVSENVKEFCKKVNIEQAVSSSYHHQSNGQVDACIKLLKQMLKKCIDTNDDPHITLL